MKPYRPHKRNREILAKALEIVESVPYPVTARWLFYRLYQLGLYQEKEAYDGAFSKLFARARRRFGEGWRPDTLVDDTRQGVMGGEGFDTPGDWLMEIAKLSCRLDRWAARDYYIELWFEARGMTRQFETYAPDVVLRPFGGDPSIPFKWEIAKHLDEVAQTYRLPIIILYFGDLDPKGMTIPKDAEAIIRKWCEADFEFIRAGLNWGHEIEFGIPEHPDKPGTYQWEALDDAQARELIERSLQPFCDDGDNSETEEEEERVTKVFRQVYVEHIDEIFERAGLR